MQSTLTDPIEQAALAVKVLDQMPVAVTVTDLDGKILFFNEYSTQVLDRKPEHLGRDVRLCHKKAESIPKIDKILQDFKSGVRREAGYEVVRSGKKMKVTFRPLEEKGRVTGCIQSVIVME